MHKGILYPLALYARPLCNPQWYPAFFPFNYDIFIPSWSAGAIGNPFAGRATSENADYTFGDRFITYTWNWECDAPHHLVITAIWELQTPGTFGKWRGEGVLDGVRQWHYPNGGDGPFDTIDWGGIQYDGGATTVPTAITGRVATPYA